ncbi:uncharacterized protein LOC121054149 [Oryza brachyantha]|uniref:DUF4220 domain-containing protein n=1 Tax=Oryza brachyantha TaxID=4533 RepID=J3LVI0_ORYBR|nr:uncharacterized protein LOC121054149 [Oryza brachyantha]
MAAGISDQIAGVGSASKLIMYNHDAVVRLVSAWEIEFVVVSSFLLQVIALFLAGYRRRSDSAVVKFIVSYSYLMTDSAATYGLGHLSVNSRPPERQQLVAFWAPFLLLHLGGPDSITAYSLEDNKLWKRILLKDFATQVLGAAYVLYKTFTAGSGPLLSAAWLIFSVGVAKYAERIWALYNGNISTIRTAVDKQNAAAAKENAIDDDDDDSGSEPQQARRVPGIDGNGDRSPEDLLLFAHSQFEVCKSVLVDSSSGENTSYLRKTIFSDEWDWKEKWTVFQMEVSLLYDIMYTKAGVIHTWYGYCLRVFSPLATVTSLVLFHLSRSTGTGTAMDSTPVLVDVVITYVLLAGAVVLDMVSLLSTAGSGWAYAFMVFRMPPRGARHGWLYHAAVCSGRWRRLHRWLESVRDLVGGAGRRKWSGAIGQYNLLQWCSATSKQRKYSSTSVEIPQDVMKLLFEDLIKVILRTKKTEDDQKKPMVTARLRVLGQKSQSHVHLQQTKVSMPSEGRTGDPNVPVGSTGLIKVVQGMSILKLNELVPRLGRFIRADIQEGILIWHIATDMYLRTPHFAMGSQDEETAKHVRAINLVSNYMMFLVLERPSMVPGLALRKQFQVTSNRLLRHVAEANGDPDRLADILTKEEVKKSEQGKKKDLRGNALRLAAMLARQLNALNSEEKFSMLQVLFEIWVEMLLYVSHRCSRESHAQKLSEGGELTTVIWIMAEQAGKFYIDSQQSGEDDVDKNEDKDPDRKMIDKKLYTG